MLGRLQVSGGARNCGAASGEGGSRFAPGEENSFQKSQQKTEEKRGNANGDDSRIDTIEVEHFAGRLDHVAHALTGVQHLGENDVGPANVVEDSEGREY